MPFKREVVNGIQCTTCKKKHICLHHEKVSKHIIFTVQVVEYDTVCVKNWKANIYACMCVRVCVCVERKRERRRERGKRAGETYISEREGTEGCLSSSTVVPTGKDGKRRILWGSFLNTLKTFYNQKIFTH